MIQPSYTKGFLMVEFMIGASIFLIMVSSCSLLVLQYQSLFLAYSLKMKALHIAQKHISQDTALLKNNFNSEVPLTESEDSYVITTSITDIDNFTKQINVVVSYSLQGKATSLELSSVVTDPVEGQGQSSCRPSQNRETWKHPLKNDIDLSLYAPNIHPTSIDMVGSYMYIGSNTATSTDPDLFIFELAHDSTPFNLVSSLNTGPGILSLKIAGNFLYAGNSSVTGQLQIIDIFDRKNPRLVSSYKLPGVYKDQTTVGNSIFYNKGKVFLGTQKSQIQELHVIDVSTSLSPHEIDTYEIGAAINALYVFKDKVYVATAKNDEELKGFNVSPQGILSPWFSYDARGSSGNGKRLSVFLNSLYFGRTQTIQDEEFDVFDTSTISSSTIVATSSLVLGSTVQGILGYKDLVFTLSNQQEDGLKIFYEHKNIVESALVFPARPLDFDCDKDTFVVIFQNSPFISLITHS